MIRINDLNKFYNKGLENENHVLKNINLNIAKGEFVSIMGKSGAGKSTLMHIMAAIDTFDSGYVKIAGLETSGLSDKELSDIRGKKVSIVMQDFALIDEFSVKDNLMLPLDYIKGLKKEKLSAITAVLAKVNMQTQLTTLCKNLSGGEKQRVAIGRALVGNPDIILADEPSGALDSENAAQIMQLFKEINSSGVTVVVITHDLDIALQSKRIITISDGKIVNDEQVFAD